MEDSELEIEASKWKIRGYGSPYSNGIDRNIIIDTLLRKDNANNSRYAIIISVFALMMSLVSLLALY